MVFPSSSTVLAAISLGFLPVTEKLTRSNHAMWHAQILSALRGAQAEHFIDPAARPPEKYLAPKGNKKMDDEPPVVNPEYEKWVAKDQQVLSYLLTSLSREIGSQVTIVTTAASAWAAIGTLHASQSRARVISTRMALATASKGAMSVSDYFAKMKSLADEMAAAGRKLEDEELVSYILTGLDSEFDSIVTAVSTRVEPITVNELFAQLAAHEQRLEIRGGGQHSSANMAAKGGRRDYSNNGGRGGGHGYRGGSSSGGQKGGRGAGRFQSGVFC